MFRRELLEIVRPSPKTGGRGLELVEGTEKAGYISSGLTRDPATGKTYPIKNGYLDLLGRRIGANNVANVANFLPGAGPLYEPLWRVHSLTLLASERFPNERELDTIADLVRPVPGGNYLDLGCSAGLYTRGLAAKLENQCDVLGIDISPSMLKEAARRAKRSTVSLARADNENLPFADTSFSGAVCGGTLNELGDPARALRETRRVLEPGGRVAIMGILRAKTPRGRRFQNLLSRGGVRFFEPEEVQSLLGNSGFEPDPLRTYNVVFFAGATRR
ncbi:MAG: class I SAM-dependent methyltransferase [Actinomycetota bacterium]|nr:class I SAM-dependent methyltransferase [Actinomycetota bacterium]